MDLSRTATLVSCLVALGMIAGFQITTRLLRIENDAAVPGQLEGLLDDNRELRQQLASLKLVLATGQHGHRWSNASSSVNRNVDTAGIALDYTLHHQGIVGCRPLCRPEHHNMLFAGRWHEAGGEHAGPPCCPEEVPQPGEVSAAEFEACGFGVGAEALDRLGGVGNGTTNRPYDPPGMPCLANPPIPDFIWGSPTHCAVIAWSAKQFCRVLGARTLLMIGDSTFYQAYTALRNTVVHGQGGCEAHIFLARADTLNNWAFGWNRGAHWLQSMLDVVPDIVVMGGAAQ